MYFPNSTSFGIFELKYCSKCIHNKDNISCPIIDLHFDWSYDTVGNEADLTKKEALDNFIPSEGAHAGECMMFVEAGVMNSQNK